jgi:hypothetical protein
MAAIQRLGTAIAGAAMALAVAVPLHAQGKSNGKGNAHKSAPPSSSPLPSPTTGPVAGASPIAWLDDASLLAPGATSLTLSIMRWVGTDLSEVHFPVIDASVGITPRLQIGATVPHTIGSADGTGPAGGMGTSFISAKIAVLTGESGIKLAVSPMIEVLAAGAAQALAPDEGRTQFGLPVSAEFTQGSTRVFASTGFFSHGVWFAGGGAGFQVSPKVGTSLSFTRSWVTGGTVAVPRNQQELSGGVSYLVKSQAAVYGAIGRTIATTDDNGAGTTISAGVTFLLRSPISRKQRISR